MKALLFLISLLAVRTACSQDIEALSKLYGSGAYSELDRQCIDLLKTFPDHPEINMLYGRSLADQEQTVKALLGLLEVQPRGSLQKRLWAFYFDDCEIVYYEARPSGDGDGDGNGSVLRCVEFEARGARDLDEALRILARYEERTGFAGRPRSKRSLFDLLLAPQMQAATATSSSGGAPGRGAAG